MSITRRDFINGTSIAILAGLTPIDILNAKDKNISNYPPSLTGLRGSHIGSFESAHALSRGHMTFPIDQLSVEETYDLVIVGAGISGLSSAYFYLNKNKNAKILILDNHDDFGGHAKRNEFSNNKNFILGYGGTESLEAPKHSSSKVVLNLFNELGIKIDKLGNKFERNFYPNLKLSRGVFFDAENFSADKIVLGDPTSFADDDIDPNRLNGRPIKEFINDFPLNENDKNALIKLYTEKIDYLPKIPLVEDKIKYLQKISYRDFLLKHVLLSEQATKFFQAKSHDFDAIGIDAISTLEARELELPGLDGMNLPADNPEVPSEPYIYHFPDGNASIARLLVNRLIPKVFNGYKDMNTIVLHKLNYSKLDLSQNSVRIRLSSTVVNVTNAKNKLFDIGYLEKPIFNSEGQFIKLGKLHKIQAKHVVMANYNMMIPDIVTELPKEQKDALSMNVKAPVIYTNVMISNWKSFIKLGVHDIYSPSMPYSRIKLDYPVNMGGYSHPRDPENPILLHMVSIPCAPNQGLDARSQFRIGRHKLLTTSFQTLENEIRNQLQRILGNTGYFNHKSDILSITVNRWAHGYSYYYNSLFDDEEQSQQIIKLARQPFGNVVIANSDSDWNPLTQPAIDQAFRAINELNI